MLTNFTMPQFLYGKFPHIFQSLIIIEFSIEHITNRLPFSRKNGIIGEEDLFHLYFYIHLYRHSSLKINLLFNNRFKL